MDEQFKRLLEICAEEFGVTVEDILGPSRQSSPALARILAMAIWSDNDTHAATARRFNRYHYTVVNARDRVRYLVEHEPWFALKASNVLEGFLETENKQ
jgi:chromosomal replication initiation ATPase DnaA